MGLFFTSQMIYEYGAAAGPKGGFKPGRGDGFLRAIKIHNTPSLDRK
jgi:hypothetical protein